MTRGNQTKRINPRDWEALSAYLDGQLSSNERNRLEKRLQASSDLRMAMDELRRTRSVLRSQPRLRAPRNFTLTPEMVGVHKRNRGFPSLFPTLGLASALASALFVVVLLVDLLAGGKAGAPAIVAMQVTQESALRTYSATEAPAAMEAPAATQAPAPFAAAPQAPSIQEQTQSQTEAPAATEAPAMALEAVDPTEAARMTAAPPGMDAMQAATQSEATPAIPTPGQVFSDTLSDQGPVASQKALGTPYPESAVPSAGTEAAEQPASARQSQPAFWTPLRQLEALLALIAVAAGLSAFVLRRTGSA